MQEDITANQKDEIIYLCSKCVSFDREEKKVSCYKGMWKNVPIKEALLYTPWDFECLEFERKM